MKTLVLIFTFIFIPIASFGQTNSDNLIASCCTEGSRCTGSTYCTACKNCSGCKHCAKNGGSCGVCSGVSGKSYNSYSEKTNISAINSSKKKTYSENTTLTVASSTLNLREGSGTQFKILEKLVAGDMLIYLDSVGGWLKVKVKKSENIGYIYYKYVNEL